ncbi:MAG: hypothetical protein N5P05_002085 [Chroococcopsis gigantea SAG 12.99]|jgi:hypothetical protein|nr:DUF3318 domain-containing protein [Chlorogloea purpurea SAG 13.99]MDV3000479.1 hypothetical protein [Chroococcopsis gigantea SAG 12.99]
MNQDTEISHLLDMMPASGRMLTRIVSKPQQTKLIDTVFPLPWQRGTRPIYINFDLWRKLSRGERDLTLLRAVAVLTGVKWFKPSLYQAVTLAGVLGLTAQVVQGDAVGIVASAALTALAGQQVWRNNNNLAKEIEADEVAIKVAGRRGYSETEAARQLLKALETSGEIEGGRSLSFSELVRCQNLKKLANLSAVGVPDRVREER